MISSSFLVMLLTLVRPGSSAVHDLHLSKALINYNEETNSVEVSLHIFIDDLELALAGLGSPDLFIATTKEDEQADTRIEDYLDSVFEVASGGQGLRFEFLGKEPSDDLMAIWCYLEATEVPKPQEVQITNRLLLDLFDDQKNVVTFMIGDHREYFLFDHDTPTGSVKL